MKESVKKVIKKVAIVGSLLIAILIVFAVIDDNPTFADSGFGTSYSGGSSHSSSHSSSSHSSSHRSYSSSHSSSSDSASVGEIVGIFIFIVIIFIISIIQSINSRRTINRRNISSQIPDESTIENEIKQYIPNFNKQEFLDSGYKIYCDVQNAWMDFKLDDVKDVITDELYNMYESQLTTLEVKGEQNVMKDFVLNRSFLKGVDKQNETITISTIYIIEFYDYIIEQSTGKVVRGTDKQKMRVKYEMKFRQTLDESKKVTKCPNCGADIEMNTTGVCDYCHSKLVTENTKWVLTEKQTLDQEFVL